MTEKEIVSKPLELSGAYNVRDLGIYENKNHQKLKEHQFLRADSLHKLTEKDQEMLISYGVKAVVDLRSQREKEQAPCVWQDSRQVDYYSVPMLDEMNSKGMEGQMPESLAELYIKLLEEGKKEYARVFQIMSKYPKECVIFHCTAGKDRTGVTAMLLLALAGVESDVIARDYSVSAEYMKPVFQGQKEQMRRLGIEIPSYVLESRKEDMEAALTHLYQKYKTAQQYLLSVGLTEEEISVLREKLCQ